MEKEKNQIFLPQNSPGIIESRAMQEHSPFRIRQQKEQNRSPALSEYNILFYPLYGAAYFRNAAKQDTCNDQYDTAAETGR